MLVVNCKQSIYTSTYVFLIVNGRSLFQRSRRGIIYVYTFVRLVQLYGRRLDEFFIDIISRV